MNDEPVLSIWTIYQSPADYPDWIVLRPHHVMRDGQLMPHPIACLCRNLWEARIGPRIYGRSCLAREEGDEPQIIESWV